MGVVKLFLLTLALAFALAAEEAEKRPTRTIARLLGFERQQVQQQAYPVQQQPQQPYYPGVPIVYNVRYFDRAGENPEVQVEQQVVQQQQQQQVQQVPVQVQQPYTGGITPSTRVFLNLYTGQPTPVYYDGKGQVYVPCPIYDHKKGQQEKQVPNQVLYYAGQPVQKPVSPGYPPVGYPPVDYAYVPTPYYGGQFGSYVNPFVFVKPVEQVQQPVDTTEKKEKVEN